MLRELEKVGMVNEVAVISDDGMDDGESVGTGLKGNLLRLIEILTERITISEKLIMEMRHEITKGKDFRLDLLANSCPGCKRTAKSDRGNKVVIITKPGVTSVAPAVLRATRPRTVENGQ